MNFTLRHFAFLIVCSLWPWNRSFAQEAETISTERPTQGFSPDLIPAGSLQIESGLGATLQKSLYSLDLPQAFIRLGVSRRFELRFSTTDAVWQPMDNTPSRKSLQSTDTQFSGKFLISKPNSWAPKSVIVSAGFPTGSRNHTSGSYDPSATLIWTQGLPHGIFLNELAQATLTTWNGARRSIWSPSIAGGAPLTKSVTIFGEYAPNILQNNKFSYAVDGGLAFTKGKLRQFDFRGGFLKDGPRSILLSIGYSVRYDRLFGQSRAEREIGPTN